MGPSGRRVPPPSWSFGHSGAISVQMSAVVPLRRARYEHPFLPTTREEMRARGWDELDVILLSGDAYVDHPAFGPALIGRFLEARGFRVGMIAQPDWRSADAFRALGR